MAETTEQPPTVPAPDEVPKSYSSLSLLAVGGLLLAVVYAVIVAGGGVIALFNRTPWVLPLWSLAAPLAAIFLCWAARVQIRNSEGALTGVGLTSWGAWLSLVIGILYGAYYSACYLSVTQMASGVADELFDDLKKGQLDKAFLLGVPPPRPADDANLRARLEVDFDHGPGGGQYTAFRRSQFVREIEQGGEATRIECLGVKDWNTVAGGGYEVQIAYRIATPYMSSEANLTAVGVENNDEGGRQWYVKIPQTAAAPVLTAEGRHMRDQVNAAHDTAELWLGDLRQWDWRSAYRLTLLSAERAKPIKEEALKAFRAGSLVHAEAPTFWASDKDREAVIADAKSLFGRGGADPNKVTLAPAAPRYERDQGQIRVGFDLQIPVPPVYMIQGRLNVVADAPAEGGDPAADAWRVESLELISGKSIGGRDGPPTPGQP